MIIKTDARVYRYLYLIESEITLFRFKSIQLSKQMKIEMFKNMYQQTNNHMFVSDILILSLQLY